MGGYFELELPETKEYHHNAIKLNNDIRSSYNEETKREVEQNITYKGDDI